MQRAVRAEAAAGAWSSTDFAGTVLAIPVRTDRASSGQTPIGTQHVRTRSRAGEHGGSGSRAEQSAGSTWTRRDRRTAPRSVRQQVASPGHLLPVIQVVHVAVEHLSRGVRGTARSRPHAQGNVAGTGRRRTSRTPVISFDPYAHVQLAASSPSSTCHQRRPAGPRNSGVVMPFRCAVDKPSLKTKTSSPDPDRSVIRCSSSLGAYLRLRRSRAPHPRQCRQWMGTWRCAGSIPARRTGWKRADLRVEHADRRSR